MGKEKKVSKAEWPRGEEGVGKRGSGGEEVVSGACLGSVNVNFSPATVPHLKHCAVGGCMRVVLC